MSCVPVITSAVSRNFQLSGSPCKNELDDPDNAKAVVNIVRKLIINGGRIELKPNFMISRRIMQDNSGRYI
ncbi:MAG: hypothetical protein ACR5K2_03455 [Wolbachia sp.]